MVNPTRVAAFEFLIQFRSAGRNQVRSAIRQMRNLNLVSNRASASIKSSSEAARLYANALRRQARGALTAAESEERLNNALRAGRLSRSFLRRRVALSNRQAADDRLGRAFSSRGTIAVENIFGPRAAGRFARGTAALGGGFAKAVPHIRAAAAALGLVTGALRVYTGLLTTFVKFNAIFIGGLALVSAGLAKLSDTFTLLSNRIRVASDGTQSVSSTMDELLNIANRARAPVNDIAELYGRIAINAKQFGISQEEILKVVEITGKTFRIGGSNAREASQAAIQFAQALGSNRLSGDELRAVREQATELSQTLARGLNASGKFGVVGVGRLKELGEQGVLTTKVVIDALTSQERIVNARFNRVEATFADGITNIRSSLGFFLGSVGSALGLGPKFFTFFDKLSEAFNRIAKNSGAFATALSRLPKFLSILGKTGLSNFIKLLTSFGDLLTSLPDKVLDFGRNINEFITQFERTNDIEFAAQSAFGVSSDQLQNNAFIRGTETFLTFFNKQLPLVISQVVAFGSALEKITNFINNFGNDVYDFSRASLSGPAGIGQEIGRRIGNNIFAGAN